MKKRRPCVHGVNNAPPAVSVDDHDVLAAPRGQRCSIIRCSFGAESGQGVAFVPTEAELPLGAARRASVEAVVQSKSPVSLLSQVQAHGDQGEV